MVIDLSTQHQEILTMFDEIMRLDLIAYVGSPLRYGNDASFTTNAFILSLSWQQSQNETNREMSSASFFGK